MASQGLPHLHWSYLATSSYSYICAASASNDGPLRLWDVRAPKPLVHSFTTGGKEIWSADMSVDSNVSAAGVEYTLRTWDLRTRKLYRSYVDAHTDDVTCVCAHPLLPSVFLTGSEDGLMCAIN